MATDRRIDAYINKSAEFARPILTHIRKLVHKACPGVEETIKWGFPHFDYKGAMCCSMAGFKEHCSFGFWKASLLKDKERILSTGERDGMGHIGKITSLKDLPPDKVMLAYIKEAAILNEEGVKLPPREKKPPRQELPMPPALGAALKKNKKAQAAFDGFPPSHRREYIEWITEAKTEETRQKRIDQAIEWVAEGKSRNWKYQRK
ncbi:MAG: YdeI/OmpD-associated family protein [Bacteroidota bacterium]|nr:YdeI/OmpD-associated family protein [Bacteroidota bacterium]MDP4215199.1 YdeI/OmpD-associated family protein [Bacteroidota bacterium]MDP4244972.1 YdeI/OmpD-associated family protein [Bacteroidota bacterium]MDP4255289.1 YdeI/OmpD-associated family protein [Bacteroidota bacterium]MDP4256721.1 YdeI/OmpD-associated family protein [Bacteroidota bacterium]